MTDRNSTDGRIESAKDHALGKHDSNPSHVDEAGEGVGGIGGVLTGAAIGSVGGPVGTIIGGVALGTMIAVTAGAVPVAPGPNMCWFWADSAQVNGYWDYCTAP